MLLDQMMPEVDGLTFLTGIRRFPKWKRLPVIMLTGLNNRTNMVQAHNLGVTDYLVKANFTLPELLERIRKALGGAPKIAGCGEGAALHESPVSHGGAAVAGADRHGEPLVHSCASYTSSAVS